MKNQVWDFFSGLFDTNLWPPRWHCGIWTDFHGWLYIISDLMIWTAYFLIPVIIINYTSKKSTGLKFPKVYFLFAAFILLCGATHFFDAMMFWIPMYKLNTLLRFATGLVSMATVYHLIKILPEAFKQKTNVELEREIVRRQEAESKLAEANAGLEAFAYMASHDLKEPLRKIKMQASMIADHQLETGDDKSRQMLQKINATADKMNHLIDGILSLSSVSENFETEKVNLNEVLQNVTDSLELVITEKKAIVTVESLPVVTGNKIYLNQLFFNLVTNAIKFSETQPVVIVSGFNDDLDAVISVADNGIGMSENNRKKIFEPFQRLNAAHKFEGSGIGLAICKKIVTAHNGTIDVESSEGQGTKFIITLPMQPA